jgi:hypothetical protein
MTAPLVVVCLGVQKAAEDKVQWGGFLHREVTHHGATAAKKVSAENMSMQLT